MERETFKDKFVKSLMKQYTHEEMVGEYLKLIAENEKLKSEIRFLKHETNKLYEKLVFLDRKE